MKENEVIKNYWKGKVGFEMKPEEIIKLLREGSGEVLEGLEAFSEMSKSLAEAARNLGDVADKAKIVIQKADNILKKTPR